MAWRKSVSSDTFPLCIVNFSILTFVACEQAPCKGAQNILQASS